MIFVPLPSPPYTDRRLSLQGSKDYSSLSTPNIFNYRIMISYFKGLSRQFPETPPELFGFRPVPASNPPVSSKKNADFAHSDKVRFKFSQRPVRGFSMLYSPSSLKDIPTVPKGK